MKSEVIIKAESVVIPTGPALNGGWGSHQFLDALALAYHRAVAMRLRAEPEAVIRVARENLARWLSSGSFDAGTAASLHEWEELLDTSDSEQLIAVITEESDQGQRLRQSSPFAGVLTDEERLEIMAACERAASTTSPIETAA
jgi:hypothetical protein